MNLKTAMMICERFSPVMAKGGLVEQLHALLEVLQVDQGNFNKDTVGQAARATLAAYAASVFADPAMRIFPEFEQLGLSERMGADFRQALQTLCASDMSNEAAAKAVSKLAREGEGIEELGEQLGKLMAVGTYFGVETRDPLDAEAVAVLQLPEAALNAPQTSDQVEDFIVRMQSFQSIVHLCENSQSDEIYNIRMISGERPLVVADMSSEGASRLQAVIAEARKIQHTQSEIDDAINRLSVVGVGQEVLEHLRQESAMMGRFEGMAAHNFLQGFLPENDPDEARTIALAVFELLEGGARLDGVVLKRDPAGKDDPRDTPPDPSDRSGLPPEISETSETPEASGTPVDHEGEKRWPPEDGQDAVSGARMDEQRDVGQRLNTDNAEVSVPAEPFRPAQAHGGHDSDGEVGTRHTPQAENQALEKNHRFEPADQMAVAPSPPSQMAAMDQIDTPAETAPSGQSLKPAPVVSPLRSIWQTIAKNNQPD